MKKQYQSFLRSVSIASAGAVACLLLQGLNTAQAATSYPATVLGDNPVAYYRLEELAGALTAFDATSNHFDALYVTNSTGSFPQYGLPGITTNSVGFNGGSTDYAYVIVPFQPELAPAMPDGIHGAPFSAECWAMATSRSGDYSSVMGMFGPYGTGTYNNASGWNFATTPGSGSVWLLNVKNGPFGQTSVPVNLLQWYHLAVTFDGSTFILYVNGTVALTSGGWTGYLSDNGAAGEIGVTRNAGVPPSGPYAAFAGNVDEAAFYTNILSATQVLNHYQVGTNSIRAQPTPPGFLQQPASTTNYSGTTASFSVVANGTTPLSYQWKRGGAPISGATLNTYSLLAHYPADNGATFSVTVSNSVGVTNSDVAILTVLTNLNINNQPYGPILRNVGSKAAFRVAVDGALPITYQWYRIANSATSVIAGATSDTLWLNNVQLAQDQSQYFARLSGPFTTNDSDPATLNVQARAVTVPVTGYARIVTSDDPVAYWRLDEAAGPTATDAVGSFDGVYGPAQVAPAPVFTYQVTGGIPNETNRAVRVAGGAVVTVPYALELNPVTGPWSMETWVAPSSTDANNFRSVISALDNRFAGQRDFGWNIYQFADAGGYWTLNLYKGGGAGTFLSDFTHHPFVINGWYHFVISDDLTTIRYYVNNVLVVTTPRDSFVPNGINGDPGVAGAPLVMGQRYDCGFDPFFGGVDETAIYNYALSANQVANHYLNNVKLSITKAGNNAVITWPGVGLTLQSSPNVFGTNFVDVAGATSPYTNAIGPAPKYFRLKLQ